MFRSLLAPKVAVSETAEPEGIHTLHPAELSCVEHAVEKRRREFATGRHCARRALALLGIDDFPLLPDEDRVPVWPPGVVGSISHCAGFFGAAVARCGQTLGLGIDVERADPLDAGLVKRICTAREIARLARLSESAGVDWHKLLFSAKESVYKAYYPSTRSFLGFHDVDLEVRPADDPRMGVFTCTITRDDAPALGGVRAFEGRYAFDAAHVYTAVVVEKEASAA